MASHLVAKIFVNELHTTCAAMLTVQRSDFRWGAYSPILLEFSFAELVAEID
ncbi:hypothetical protein GPB2148_1310 [marine gamma proteobacterium HTCC2148]|nr:hypothetical protein GPB2148_1310 [marine gamma proteobacterium HTCC2148]